MAKVQNQDRLVRESFVRRILENLYNWLPFKKETEKIDFVVGEEAKTVFSIASNGEIFYIAEPNTTTLESLQTRLNKAGLQVIETETEFENLCNNANIGKLIYLNNSGENYVAGLYSIILDASNRGNIEPKILSQDIKNELNNYYNKEEINSYFKNYVSKAEIETFVTEENVQEIIVKKLEEIIKTDEDGNISIKLDGYVTIDEFNSRIDIIENWMGMNPEEESGAISLSDLETITQIDINNDSKIG
jgi:hypothetical protein